MKRALTLTLLLTACGGAAPHVETTPTDTATTPPAAPTFVEPNITAVHGAFVASLETPVTSFGAAVLDGSVYVAGGYHGTPHDYDREGQSQEVLSFTRGGHWEHREPMERGLQGFAFVAAEGGLVRCGGTRIDNAPGAPTDMRSIATCMRYVSSDAWEPFPDLPAPRSSFDAAVLDGHIYAVGGWNLEGDQSHATFATTMDVFDPTTRTWSTEACPVSRRALAVVATTHAIVAIGGLDAALHVSTAASLYDPATHAWSEGPAFPGEGFGMAAAAIGDTVYASGADGVVYRWTPGESAWTRFASLAQPRFFHRLVPVGTDLYAIGGIGSMTMDGRAALVESISTTDPVTPAIGWVELDFPGHARNRFAAFADDDSLYVLGGNDSPEQHDFAPENFVSEAFRLHVPSLRWYPLAPLPEGRQSMESVVVGDEVLAIGGFGHDGRGARTFADAFVVRDEGPIALVRDVLPTGRTQFGTAVFEDALWIFGGLVFDETLPEDQQFTHLSDVLRCPLRAAAPTPLEPCETIDAHMTGTRRAFASAALGGHVFIVGGMREGFAPVDDCLDFDLAARTFAPMTCPAHVRISATMLAHEGHLYLVGGSARTSEGLSSDRSIEVYDPETRAWRVAIDPLPFETHQGRWAFVGDRLVMLSTQAEAGHALLAIVDVPH